MLRKIKNASVYLNLTQSKRQKVFHNGKGSPEWRNFDPGEKGTAFREKIKALAAAGDQDCFIFIDASLKSQIRKQLPFWISQLKKDHPQMDFHIGSGGLK